MPERLPRELRVLYDVAHVVAEGPYAHEDVLARIVESVRGDFGFAEAAFVRPGEEAQADAALLEAALAERRAVVRGDEVAVPLLDDGRCHGFVVGRGRRAPELGPRELQLLSAVGLIAAVFVAKAAQYADLQGALEELRRVDELKDQFVSVASHELRTPIAIVHGIAVTLHERGGELDEERQVELRSALYEQSGRLRDLTEQLLDLSRFDAGRIRVAETRFRPRETVDELLPRIAPGRVDDVEVDIDPRLQLVSDPDAFERVVSNLVGNALRYGRPPVLVRGENGGGSFLLFVEDCGPGVAPAFVPQLFERFTRADQAGGGRAGGAGLGLAIASQFAEALGGGLRYEPARPCGARFVFELPA